MAIDTCLITTICGSTKFQAAFCVGGSKSIFI